MSFPDCPIASIGSFRPKGAHAHALTSYTQDKKKIIVKYRTHKKYLPGWLMQSGVDGVPQSEQNITSHHPNRKQRAKVVPFRFVCEKRGQKEKEAKINERPRLVLWGQLLGFTKHRNQQRGATIQTDVSIIVANWASSRSSSTGNVRMARV